MFDTDDLRLDILAQKAWGLNYKNDIRYLEYNSTIFAQMIDKLAYEIRCITASGDPQKAAKEIALANKTAENYFNKIRNS